MFLKLLVGDLVVTAVILALSQFDQTMQTIVLVGAAAGVVSALWVKLLRPFIHLVHRALTSFEYLEQLPTLVERVDRNENALQAIQRELGIESRGE